MNQSDISQTIPTPAPPSPSQPLRVLLVEDSEVDAGLLVRELARSGYAPVWLRVQSAADLRTALAREPWDIVLSDYAMPQFGGLEALQIVQTQDPDQPFILISGTIGEEVAVGAMRAGAHDYLLKDHLTRLGSAVARELRDAAERRARRRAEQAQRLAEAETRRLLEAAEEARRTLLSVVEDQKRTEQKLSASETRFQQVAAHLGEWVWEVDADGLYTYSSPVVEKNLGYHPEELVGKRYFYDLFPLAERETLKASALEHFKSMQPFVRFRNHCVHRDGHLVLLETSGTPLLDSEARLLGYRGVDSDITERERKEEHIRAQAELLDLAQDAIAVKDMNGCVQYWNKSYERLTGWSAAEAVGQSIMVLVKPDRARFDQAGRILLEQGHWSGELALVRKDGSPLTLMSRWTLVRDEQGGPKAVLAINTDITEQKKMEAQFLRAQRLEGVGSLASGLAHDLNNILAPVLMIAPLLRATVQDEDSGKMLDSIESCAQRGADIIKQLLTFARGAPGARVPLPLRHLLRDMEKIIRETFPRNIRPVVDAPKDLWPVLGDATQFHQVLMNLCVNARDAMPDGGTLTVGAKNVAVDESFASMTLDARTGAYVCVSVSDTGMGIAPENLNRIFDPFFTTKEIGKGTGLGLATVLGIVRGHEGFLRVDSRLGHGTTFELYFPASPEAQSASQADREAGPPDGQGELILVVDDEATVRDGVQRTLEKHGYRTVQAAQGSEAVAIFSQQAAQIRAVLTDMMMPGMSGPELIAVLKHMAPDLLILGMTGLPERNGMKGLENLNLPSVLAKPFSGDELLRVLHDALHPPETGPEG